MITADQLVLHGIGDYLIQSDYMAATKTSKTFPALIHVITYTTPFLLITNSPYALAFILVTHFVIDRWRLARYFIYARNIIGGGETYPWKDCSGTGFHKDRPAWLATWLLIITDNIMHIVCNGIALEYLAF